MKIHTIIILGPCILLVLRLGFSEGQKVYRTIDECRQIGDNRQQTDCIQAVTGRNNAFNVQQSNPVTEHTVAPIYDTTFSYSINGEDTTKTIQIQKRVDISGIHSEISKLSSATVFIAVMQGLSVLGGIITIFVVANK